MKGQSSSIYAGACRGGKGGLFLTRVIFSGPPQKATKEQKVTIMLEKCTIFSLRLKFFNRDSDLPPPPSKNKTLCTALPILLLSSKNHFPFIMSTISCHPKIKSVYHKKVQVFFQIRLKLDPLLASLTCIYYIHKYTFENCNEYRY